ncbi:hypothetical protein SAMN04487972_10975 [Paracoccus halophilus]|uniref:Uncharacterized protein n=1 Tax=Paracoccus halophilus TaxID=376733 RepID=A0A1I0TKZ9_9RHOB|nr:hypothetical protein [Paracoccus halophilus]SFA52213.1 hypothetical protein SAMN04487972_10975 [Paracoccus halophilus]
MPENAVEMLTPDPTDFAVLLIGLPVVTFHLPALVMMALFGLPL